MDLVYLKKRKKYLEVIKKNISQQMAVGSKDFTFAEIDYASNSINMFRNSKYIKEMNVGCILDPFSYECFKYEFNAIKLSPYEWYDQIIKEDLDLLFVESAWEGNDCLWKNKVGTSGKRDHSELLVLLEWCKEHKIPTIFWNKEDPFHFNAFIETALNFDYVFTTDKNSIKLYEERGCKKVYVLPFAAQPKIHNPIEKYKRKNKVVFAGAYYGNKFPERKRIMDSMIEICGEHGLEIYDRNFKNDSPNQFPEEFKKFIKGTLKVNEIDKAYKGYKVVFNVNSIIDSPTMFSRRVFEILASNTPIVSSESEGIRNIFNQNILATKNIKEIEKELNKLFADEEYYENQRDFSLYEVLENHTYEKRIEYMLDTINYKYKKHIRDVAIIGVVKSQTDYEKLIKQYVNQSYSNKELIILLDIFDGYIEILNDNNKNNIKTFLLDYIHNYKNIEEITKAKYLTAFNIKKTYDKDYLKKLILSTKYTDAEVIGYAKNKVEKFRYNPSVIIEESIVKTSFLNQLTPKHLLKFFNDYNEQDFLDARIFKI